MAKKSKTVAADKTVETKQGLNQKGLDISVGVVKGDKGRITVTVKLFQDGKEVASDSDWVFVD
jgi:hypothetical protein